MNSRQSWALGSDKTTKLLRYVEDGSLYPRFYHWLTIQHKNFRERLWGLLTAVKPVLAQRLETGAILHLYGDLLVEFNRQNAHAAGTTCTALYQLLLMLGYQLYKIDASQRKLAPAAVQEHPYENLLATKNVAQVSRRTGYQCEAGV